MHLIFLLFRIFRRVTDIVLEAYSLDGLESDEGAEGAHDGDPDGGVGGGRVLRLVLGRLRHGHGRAQQGDEGHEGREQDNVDVGDHCGLIVDRLKNA